MGNVLHFSYNEILDMEVDEFIEFLDEAKELVNVRDFQI